MNNQRIAVALAFAAVLAAPLSLLADGTHVKGDTPIQISHGEVVKLTDYVVTGKTTVFDFFSEYCPPCRAIGPRLQKLHETHPDLAVVMVDINRPDTKGIDWQSPVAREFALESIPHFQVYGPDGRLKADGDGAYDMVMGWLE
jgi:thiol-disulfide isomerase/thioredoxin